MAESGAAARRRRGPAPIASFDHECSDESSPETKQFRLPEIREDLSSSAGTAPGSAEGAEGTEGTEGALAAGGTRARSGSAPGGALGAPAAPRIDISRASSSSHHDSRGSSPDPAAPGDLGFREDGALDLRSSTEELAFLEPAPEPPRRAPRRDSQGSEAALLHVSGRTSRLSSVGSQCSAHSALSAFSRTGRLSIASDVSRSPSPHKMLLETSFCGPKPIETDPEVCAAAVEESLLEIAKLNAEFGPAPAPAVAPAPAPTPAPAPAPASPRTSAAGPAAGAAPVDARDRREVRTEATVERPTARPAARPVPAAQAPSDPAAAACRDEDKNQKETTNRARAEHRQARSRERRDPTEPRVKSKSKDIIRIRLKPDHEYDDRDVDDDCSEVRECAPSGLRPESASGPRADCAVRVTRPTELAGDAGPAPVRPRDSRTPSPAGVIVSRKSSFCSLFKSRETIASPESPSDLQRRKKSVNDGRSRSRSRERDRSTTPTSSKIRGSVLSLFRTPRRSVAEPSPAGGPSAGGPRAVSPGLSAGPPTDSRARAERLKYYEDTSDGIIHIPLRTPPDGEPRPTEPRPASAPQPRISGPILTPVSTAGPTSVTATFSAAVGDRTGSKPIQRTVLPDGSIIIPLHSPTERTSGIDLTGTPPVVVAEKPKETSRPVVSPEPAAAPTRAEPPPPSEPSSPPYLSGPTSPALPSGSTTPAFRSGSTTPAAPSGATTPAPSRTSEPGASPSPAADAAGERRRRERLTFTTNVGSRDQVFSTQFSITKTPSVTSEISASFGPDAGETGSSPTSGRESSGSEAGGATGAGGAAGAGTGEAGGADTRAGSEAEQRGLVVQQSFEDELPFVPTTLPQERPRALPMMPVAARRAAPLAPAASRPRPTHAKHNKQSALPPPPAPVDAEPARAADGDKLRIRLPRRPRAGSAGAPPPPPPRGDRARTRSGSEGLENRAKTEWIDFEEVPERRKQPKRIQTLPAATARDVVFSYVAPEDCRCECHARDSSASCSEHARGS